MPNYRNRKKTIAYICENHVVPLHEEWNLPFESVHDIADHRAPVILRFKGYLCGILIGKLCLAR